LFVVALLALAASTAATTATSARLRLEALQPMTVRGTGFHGRERVRVTLYRDGERNVRVVRAGSAGRFIARFTVMVGHCDGWSLVAKDNRGSVARLHRDPRGDCASP
jgi:hypothetical protein